MVILNEWQPNPVGVDAKAEWVEIFNNGSESVSLAGWRLQNGKGARAYLSGRIQGGEFVVIEKPALSLTLRNSEEALFLFDQRGVLISSSSFRGTAPEARSLARSQTGVFTWTEEVSPGHENIFPTSSLASVTAPETIFPTTPFSLPFLLLGTSIFMSLLLLYTVRHDQALHHILLEGDAESSEDDSAYHFQEEAVS